MTLSVLRSRLAQQKFSYRLLSGVSWSLVGSIFAYAGKLLMSIVLARLLGQTAYGEFGIITSTVLLFATFAGIGLGITGTKYLAEYRQDELIAGQIIGILLFVSLLFGILLASSIYLMADFLSVNALNAPNLSSELKVGSYFILFIVLFNVQVGVLTGFECFRALAVISALEGVFLLSFSWLGATLYGLNGAVWGFGLASALVCIPCLGYSLYYCRDAGIPIRLSFGRFEYSIFFDFGFPALVVLILPQIFTWLTRIVLAYQPDGYSELGLLNVGFAWSALILFIPRQISKPALPILTNLYATDDMSEYRHILNLYIVFSLGVTLLLVLPIMLLSKNIMNMYGSEFIESWIVLVLMVAAFGFGAITITFRDLIASQGSMWLQAYHAMVWGIVLVALTYIMRTWGAQGTAISFCVAYVVLVLLQFIYLRSKIFSSHKVL